MNKDIVESVAFKTFGPQPEADVTEQADFTESVEQNQAKLHRSIEKRNADLFQMEMAAARGGGKGLEKLAHLAPTALQYAKPWIDERNTRLDVEAADKAQEFLKNNPGILSQGIDVEDAQLAAAQLGNEAIVDNAQATGEIDLFAAKEFRELPIVKDRRFRKALLKEAASGYGGFYLQNSAIEIEIQDKDGDLVTKSLNDTTDPFERQQILAHINRAYRRPFADWDQAQVYKHLGNHMERFESQEDQRFVEKQRLGFETLKTEKRYTSISEALDNDSPAQGLQQYLLNNKSKFAYAGKDSMKLARLQLSDDLLTMVKEERYSDIEKVRTSLFTDEVEWNDGTIDTFANKYKSDFERLDRAFAQADKAEMEETRLKYNNRVNEFEASVIKLMDDKYNSKDPNEDTELTNSDITRLSEQFRAEFPNRPLPEFLSNIVTREERVDQSDQEILETIFRENGVVYGSDTAGMSFSTQKWAKQKFGEGYIEDDGGSVAQQYAAMQGEANTQIDNMVSEHFMVTAGDMKDNEEIGEARRQAKDSFSKIFWKHYRDPATAGFDDARVKAMNEIRDNLKNNQYQLKLTPSNNTNILKKRNSAYKMVRENPKGFKDTLINESAVDIAVLRKIQAGTTNEGIPSIYQYYAHLNPKLDLDAWDVANAQLKIWEKENGLPVKGLGRQPPLKEYVEGLTSPLEKRFLKSRPSYGRTTRVMVMQEGGDFNNPDLVVNGAL